MVSTGSRGSPDSTWGLASLISHTCTWTHQRKFFEFSCQEEVGLLATAHFSSLSFCWQLHLCIRQVELAQSQASWPGSVSVTGLPSHSGWIFPPPPPTPLRLQGLKHYLCSLTIDARKLPLPTERTRDITAANRGEEEAPTRDTNTVIFSDRSC